MPVDNEKIIDILYVRGDVTAPGIAAEVGEGIESIDVSARLMDLLLRGLVEEIGGRPPRWRLTDAGIQLGWDRKARASG